MPKKKTKIHIYLQVHDLWHSHFLVCINLLCSLSTMPAVA